MIIIIKSPSNQHFGWDDNYYCTCHSLTQPCKLNPLITAFPTFQRTLRKPAAACARFSRRASRLKARLPGALAILMAGLLRIIFDTFIGLYLES
jgi:hypothetical protein